VCWHCCIVGCSAFVDAVMIIIIIIVIINKLLVVVRVSDILLLAS